MVKECLWLFVTIWPDLENLESLDWYTDHRVISDPNYACLTPMWTCIYNIGIAYVRLMCSRLLVWKNTISRSERSQILGFSIEFLFYSSTGSLLVRSNNKGWWVSNTQSSLSKGWRMWRRVMQCDASCWLRIVNCIWHSSIGWSWFLLLVSVKDLGSWARTENFRYALEMQTVVQYKY